MKEGQYTYFPPADRTLPLKRFIPTPMRVDVISDPVIPGASSNPVANEGYGENGENEKGNRKRNIEIDNEVRMEANYLHA